MPIKIIAVGKQREKGFVLAADEYARRLTRYTKLTITEVADEKDVPEENKVLALRAKQIEGERILARISANDYVIALEIDGQEMTSAEFSKKISSWHDQSVPVCFVIGGSLGLPDSVLKRAQENLSFSTMTFPHQLARVMLLEQIYRAYKIKNSERYHK